MVKLSSIPGKSFITEFESLQKSSLQMLFLCSIISHAAYARKDDAKNHDAKIAMPYRFSYEMEDSAGTGRSNFGRHDESGSNWSNMKSSYGYRSPNAGTYKMVDYLGEDYGFSHRKSPNEPNVAPSNPSDVILRGKDNLYQVKGQTNSPKINLKNMIQSLKQEQEMLEQKPERLTRQEEEEAGDDDDVEEDENEMTTTTNPIIANPTATTTTTTTPIPTTITTTINQPSQTPAQTVSTPLDQSSAAFLFNKLLSTNSANSINTIQGREVEGRPTESPSLSSTLPSPSTTFPPNKSVDLLKSQAKEARNNLHNKLSIHQLISESMPTLQMSVVPVYFVNKATKSLVAIPYLVMKSISKMPLLPNMLDSAGNQPGGPTNLINYVNTPFNQRLQSRSINHLSPLMNSFDQDSERSRSTMNHDKTESSDSTWLTINGNGHQHFNSHFWKK